MASNYTPKRVVSLQPSATVILHAIGQLDRLVACTKYCVDVCAEVKSGRIILEDSWTAKADPIIAARPDLVIAAVPYQEKAVAEILKAGARFLGLAPKSLADIFTDICAIAGIMGVPDRGESVVSAMRAEIDHTRDRTRGLPRPRVFCEEWGKPLIASQGWVAELVEAAGGSFLGKPGAQCSPDHVAERDPDVLIAAWCGAGDRVPLEKTVRNRGWSGLRAVTQGRVYCVRDEFLNTPAPTLILGLKALAAALHPELFPPIEGLRCITDVSAETRVPKERVV
jgi:iron complex transport system substrate-binding protein